MKHLALLAAVYAVTAALVLPSSLFASEDPDPAPADPPAAETAPAEEAPPAPPEPAPAPEQPAPAAEQPAAPAPEQPAAAPEQPAAPAPAPAEQPARERKKKTSAKAAASGSVAIADFQFTPGQITINQGDTVTWTNNGPTPHSATAPDGSFDTGIFPAGQSRSHTFNDAGTFSYICTPHPQMQGTIVVQASQSGGDTPDSSTGGSGGTTGGDATGAEAAQSDGGPSLPSTGADSAALLVLGALMLLLGVGVHRRARAEQPRPAGRIGW